MVNNIAQHENVRRRNLARNLGQEEDPPEYGALIDERQRNNIPIYREKSCECCGVKWRNKHIISIKVFSMVKFVLLLIKAMCMGVLLFGLVGSEYIHEHTMWYAFCIILAIIGLFEIGVSLVVFSNAIDAIVGGTPTEYRVKLRFSVLVRLVISLISITLVSVLFWVGLSVGFAGISIGTDILIFIYNWSTLKTLHKHELSLLVKFIGDHNPPPMVDDVNLSDDD